MSWTDKLERFKDALPWRRGDAETVRDETDLENVEPVDEGVVLSPGRCSKFR